MRLLQVFVHVLVQSAALGLMVTALHAPAAQATVVVMPTLEEMTLKSEVIAHVVVGEQRVVKDGGRILTYTILDVKDGVKGAKTGDTLEVFQVGGDYEGKTAWIVGAHHFVKGEELVFFGVRLSKDPTKVVPYGIGVGLFAVQQELTGTKVVELIGDVAVVEMGADGKPRDVVPTPRRYDSVDGFKQNLLRILDGQELPQLPVKNKLGPRIQKPKALAPTAPKGE